MTCIGFENVTVEPKSDCFANIHCTVVLGMVHHRTSCTKGFIRVSSECVSNYASTKFWNDTLLRCSVVFIRVVGFQRVSVAAVYSHTRLRWQSWWLLNTKYMMIYLYMLYCVTIVLFAPHSLAWSPTNSHRPQARKHSIRQLEFHFHVQSTKGTVMSWHRQYASVRWSLK